MGAMRISKRAEYALRALTAMARKPVSATSQIEELSVSERIPVKVLEQTLLVLKKADLLRSKRGVGGGYQLVRPPTALTLGDVLRAVDGPFQPLGPDSGAGPGLTAAFARLRGEVNVFLDGTTIADVLAGESPLGAMHFEI